MISGTRRQLLYFLGLFPNLDDLRLIRSNASQLSSQDPVPAPQSASLLQGKLTPNSFNGEVCLRDLSNLTGSLRFRYMDMREAGGASPPLKTRGDTFEILRTYPTDHSGTGRSSSILKGPRLPDLVIHGNERDLITGL